MLIAAAAAGCTTRQEPADGPRRLVLIVVDMLRSDALGCYGGPASTPAIDALSRQGFMHPHAVSAFHQTTMSMAALFTGRTPSIEGPLPRRTLPWNSSTWCGLRRFATGGDDSCVPQKLSTLAETLADCGYWTAGIASNPLLFDPLGYSQGFDRWDEVGTPTGARASGALANERAAAAVNAAAFAALDERPRDRFFLYVHYMDVHDYGYLGLPYHGAVERVDAAVGELVAGLATRGLLDGATILLTSDHGETLGEKHALAARRGHEGNPSFESLLRVPLIVTPAPRVAVQPIFRGQETRFLIESIAGVASPQSDELEAGESFLTERQFRTYRRYPFKAMWDRRNGRFALFDIEADRGELRNLARQRPADVAAIKRRIEDLTGRLRSRAEVRAELSASDQARLRALGYLD